MICRPVQFLYVERQASKYQLISYQDGGCRPGDSTRLDTMVSIRYTVSIRRWHTFVTADRSSPFAFITLLERVMEQVECDTVVHAFPICTFIDNN